MANNKPTLSSNIANLRKHTHYLTVRLSRFVRKTIHKLPPRLRTRRVKYGVLAALAVIVLADLATILNPFFVQNSYALGKAEALLPAIEKTMASKLTLDSSTGQFSFNNGQTLPTAEAINSGASLISAVADADPTKGITVTDPVTQASFGLTPKFKLLDGRQDGNRIIYPMANGKGWVVYTMQATGVKEDIVLSRASGDKLTLDYTLNLGDGLVPRLESDGSIGVYGNTTLTGNITTGSDSDAALLQKARENADKNTFLFGIPRPIVIDTDKKESATVSSSFYLDGNNLTVTTTGLKDTTYPISIDPSIYVVTAQQFMQGNNETNINFNVANKLIEKSPTTGARFDTWDTTTSLSAASWGSATAVAGGYIYSVGGTAFTGQTFTTQGTDTYVVPAGVTSITIEMWGAGGGGAGGGNSQPGGAGGGGGYTQSTITVTPGETLTVYVGGGGGGGTFDAGGNDAGGGGGGGGYTSVYRTSTALAIAAGGAGGGGGRQGIAGGAGGAGGGTTGVTGGSISTDNGRGGTGGTPTVGGTAGTSQGNDGAGGASLTGGAGGDGRTSDGADGSGAAGGLTGGGAGGSPNINTTRAGGGGGGGGLFGGAGGGATTSSTSAAGGGGGGGSSYTIAGSTGVTNTAGSGTTPGNSGDANRAGAADGGAAGAALGSGTAGDSGLAVISYGTGSLVNQTVSWAQFNTTTGEIESPNPGNGVCSGWCTSSAYNLPAARTNFSLVAYNGFLYAFGGVDDTGTRQSTVYISKLGANGEPRLWHPTDTNKNNWVYWYTDTSLSSIRSESAAVAYNNRMYLIAGRSTSGTPVTTVEIANINPTGTLGTWTSSTALSAASYGHGAQVYNDRLYRVGGAATVGGAPVATVSYNKINSNGTLNSWVSTSAFSAGRITHGGNMSAVWGGYIYLSGGCTAVNGSGYCTTIASDTQVASINADGSLDVWNTVGSVSSQRTGAGLVAWRNKIYNVGGCSTQNTSTGDCNSGMLDSIVYGTINPDGDASTVDQSVASGTAPCSGGSPYSCNHPSASVGNVLNSTAILNGYLYIMAGCTNDACTTVSSGVVYAAIGSDGALTKPAVCTGGSYTDSYCVSPTSLPAALGAAGTTIFNNRIYVVGGFPEVSNNSFVYYTTVNADGSIGAWQSADMSTIGATDVSYAYVYSRANPASAGSIPGNMYIFGGCNSNTAIGCSGFTQAVYKCDLSTTGVPSGCTTTGQLQIGTVTGASGVGLGAHAGTVYANYIYLIGGLAPSINDLKTVRYAKFNNSNNVIAASGSAWVESGNQTIYGRRRGAAFGYNGYIYVVGGFDGTGGGVLADIEFAKINVSDGSIGAFTESSVTINQRWGLSVPVSNSFAYVIGGCTTGDAPSSCTLRTNVVQTFQLYNNDSGAPAGYATSANTYGTSPNRTGVSSAVYNGYLYAAGGCTGASDCMSPVTTVSYAAIDTQGALGSWSNTTGSLPAARGWGKLLAAGGSLYYAGGQDGDGIPQSTVYYGTPSSGNVSSWSTSSNALPAARTRFGAAVWNDRLYVAGGNSTTQNTVVYNTAGSGTFVVPTGVTSLTVKAWGAGGAGGNGSGSTGIGGGGGGGGFTQSTLTVTAGTSLTYNVGTAGSANTTASYAGNGGGFTALLNGATYLIQAGGGGGGGGSTGTSNGGQGGGGGGSSGTAGTAGSGAATVGGLGGAGTNAAGGAAGTAGTGGVAGISGNANNGGDAGGSLTNCTTAITGRGGNGGTGAGGKGGNSATCVNGGGGGGGRFGGGGGGSGSNAAVRGGGGGGGGSDLVTGASTTETAGSAGAAGVGGAAANNADAANVATAGKGGNGSTGTASTAGQPGLLVITYGTYTAQSTVYVSPQLSSGGNIGSAWSSGSTSFSVARISPTVVAYANNLYVMGGYDGTNYLSDTQFSQINSSTGNAGSWTYSESMPNALAGGDAFAANGYIYVVGGRSSDTTCEPVTLAAPISANTTIASGNNPTGMGTWFETNQRYTGARYGNAVSYSDGKAYILGGGCGSTVAYGSPVTQQTTLLSQPQVAKYSIAMDTDSDVFPTNWLLNGLDNAIGASWQLKYRSMTNTTTSCTSPAMTTWGTETVFGNVTLGLPGVYTPRDGSNVNTNCARFYYFNVTIDSSQAFGYPDDVTRGPTITDLTLQFTADPSKRLMHGRTFTGGLQQPDDTPYYTY